MITVNKSLRILPVHVIHPRSDREQAVRIGEELESLVKTLGGNVVDRVIQKIDRPDNATYIGKGKVTEVSELVKDKKIDVVVLNAMAKPGQIHNLKSALQKSSPTIEVWDRVDLILQIFEKHASSIEAKLQIELARMRYMGPRIYGMGYVMSRQGGGIGTLGVGETNTELMKRHLRHEMKKLTDELEKISKKKATQLDRRRRAGFKTVSIVGYTNAGKSSLFNLLSGKNVLEDDALFATLDSTVGKVYFKELNQEVLLSDTIGFIRSLPPRLISAFKSTLMESIYADILLHVIDVSDPEVHLKIAVVNKILEELGRDPKEVLYIFNKTDKFPHLDKEGFAKEYISNSPLFISVKDKQGIEELRTFIGKKLASSDVLQSSQ